MAEEAVVIENATKPEPTIVDVKNPFDESSWSTQPPEQKTVQVDNTGNLTEVKTPGSDEETVDDIEYLSKQTGWKSWDEAKAAKTELDELKKQPKNEPFKFANEASEKYFNAIKEGKEDDIYSFMQNKKQLEKAEKLDATKPKEAAEIIKLDLQYKHKDLTPDEIDYLFDEKFSAPDKPKQGVEQDDDSYAESVANWEKKVKMIEKKLVIEAKMAKPELSKFKSELVLPDIPKAAQQSEEPSQELLDQFNKTKSGYLQSFEGGYKSFDGFATKVKDESVELPISFKATDEDKSAIKKIAEDILFDKLDVNDYFDRRWFQKDDKGVVSPNVNRIMSDLMLLEKSEKVFQAIANNAASGRLAAQIKQKSNINVTGNSTKTNLVQPDSQRQKEEEAIWSA